MAASRTQPTRGARLYLLLRAHPWGYPRGIRFISRCLLLLRAHPWGYPEDSEPLVHGGSQQQCGVLWVPSQPPVAPAGFHLRSSMKHHMGMTYDHEAHDTKHMKGDTEKRGRERETRASGENRRDREEVRGRGTSPPNRSITWAICSGLLGDRTSQSLTPSS